ncbi:MAG: sugar transferase [Candidatus Aureabacteria bacterium]|nr:sugar transferase [Candidatus Auribacterota bacterium]
MNNPRASFLSKETLVVLSLMADAVLVVAADFTAFFIRFGVEKGPLPRFNFTAYLQIVFPIIVLRLACFYIYGLYDKPKYRSLYDTVLNVVKAATVSTLIIIVVAFLTRAFAYPRLVIILSWFLTVPYIIVWRLITRKLINWMMGKDYFISHTLIVGMDRDSQRMATRVVREAGISRQLVGFIEVEPGESKEVGAAFRLGTLEDLPRIISEHTIDEVVIASSRIPKERILLIFALFGGHDVIFRIIPNLYEATIGSMAASTTERVPMISPTSSQKHLRYKELKRLLDTGGAFLGLIALSPALLIIAALIRLTSGSPVIYRQRRVGLHGRVFTLFKFRTMARGSEAHGPEFAHQNDRRLTRVGRLLRRIHLDELPQLFNVIVNDMSLIGPRPERPYFFKELAQQVPFYAERLEVKPGITGWAQVIYGYASTPKEHQEKLLYDIFYIENMSVALDLLIVWKTLGAVIRG